MTGVLLTRPHAKSVSAAQRLSEKGYHTFIAPCLQANAVTFLAPCPSKYKGVIFTSAQAVKTFTNKLAEDSPYFFLPALCVGNNTANAAKRCGFKKSESADGNAADLKDHVIKHNAATPKDDRGYLYVRAYDVAAPIEDWLAEQNITLTSLVTYKTTSTDSFPYEVITAIKKGQIQSILFFSARTAKNFGQLIRKHRLEGCLNSIKALSISAGVLGCVQDLDWQSMHHADKPTKDALYALLQKLCPKD